MTDITISTAQGGTNLAIDVAKGTDLVLDVSKANEITLVVDQGIQGQAATIAVGSTTTLSAGSSATVNNSGTSSSAIFNFGIPQGAKGDAGAGVATGGTTGQVLTKTSNANYATNWTTPATGTVTNVAATGGTGISISGSPITSTGTLNITNTAPDQVVSLTGSGSTTVTGTYPNFTINSTSSSGTVTAVTGTAPVVSSGGTAPAISMAKATTSVDGYLSATDWTTFNNKGSGTVTNVAATAGTGIAVTGSPITSSGTLNITNTAPDQTVVLTAGTGISTSGTYPNFTITNTSPSSGGTVTSVAATVPSFLSVSGSPITTSGTLALTYSGTALPVANGGTGQTTASAAFNALSPLTTAGDTLYGGTSGAGTRLAIGTAGQVLTVNSGATAPQWSTPTTGTVTSVSGTGTVSGISLSGTVTSSGSLTLGGTLDLSSPPAIGGTTANTGIFSLISSTRINPRVTNITSNATITPPSDTVDQYSVTALAVPATIAIPSGTAVSGQKLTLRIKDDGTARALTWTTSAGGYRVIGSTLPTTTVASKVVYIGCIYNATESFWDVVAVAQQA